MAIASCASPRRSHATKCLLRRQTKSQRDFVHHRRLARVWRVACLRCVRGCVKVVKSDISRVLMEFSVFSFKPGPRMGLIQEETGGGSGYDHPSPSIPLPVEGRGKPVATWPGILGALDANVTCCKTRHLHNVFLKSEALGWRRLGKLVRWDVNSGAHGVTRPTAHGLVAMYWVIVGCGFKA